jgi:hypothetical protein
MLISEKSRDFNTLVLKSRCFGFSEISDEISEGEIRMMTIFLKKMVEDKDS